MHPLSFLWSRQNAISAWKNPVPVSKNAISTWKYHFPVSKNAFSTRKYHFPVSENAISTWKIHFSVSKARFPHGNRIFPLQKLHFPCGNRLFTPRNPLTLLIKHKIGPPDFTFPLFDALTKLKADADKNPTFRIRDS